MEMGSCSKVHSLQLRPKYDEAKAKGQDNYDRDLEDIIDRLIIHCDKKITNNINRLEDEDSFISVSGVTQSPEILELSKQIGDKLKEVDQCYLEDKTDMKSHALKIVDELRTEQADKQSALLHDAFNKYRVSLPQPLQNPPPLAPLPLVVPDAHTQELIREKLKKAEDLGEQGMVDEVQKTLEEAEVLKKTDQKLCVCDICGEFLSVFDRDRRLVNHFRGKLHLGYMQMREKIADIQAT